MLPVLVMLVSIVSEHLGHPDHLTNKLVDASDVGVIQDLTICVEKLLHSREVSSPEDCHQAHLPQHWQNVLDHSRAAQATRRNAAHADRLVDVFLQLRIAPMLS